MKKIYNIILTTVVCLAGLAACTHDYPVGEMARNISVAPDAQQTAAAGQSFDVAVTADGAWVADTPEWISVTPANGEGNATVKVTVAANEGGERTDNVKFYSAVGDVSSTSIALESTPLAELTVVQAAGEGQGGGDNTITIADYLALGANTDPYIITGTITRVANTSYGNFDLTDETGTIYIYGLLNEELEAQKCWKEKELAMGDILTIQASNLQFYEKDQIWEIVNAVYVSHEKSLIDVDADLIEVGKEGADFTVVATVKGEDVKVDFDADWITFKGATKDGEEVTAVVTLANCLVEVEEDGSTVHFKLDVRNFDFKTKQGAKLTITVTPPGLEPEWTAEPITEEPTVEEPPYEIMGDVNNDGVVDILDAVLVQKYSADKAELSQEQIKVADFNGDGNVDILDATAIQKTAASA